MTSRVFDVSLRFYCSLQDVQYTPGRWYLDGAQSSCHTSTFAILLTEEETGQMQSAFLLQEILTMLGAWKEPLSHAVTELSRMEEAPTAIIAKANIVDTAMRELQEGIRRILGTIHPGFPESYVYPYWNGLASFQSPDEDTRFFALYNLFRCLTKDSRKVDFNLRLLMCQLVYKIDC
nr:prolactin-6A1-like [Peromyscus maniculatus bairdii]